MDTERATLWLAKASHDLQTVANAWPADLQPTDTTCFHAHQAAEKALTAVLAAEGVEVPRIHDLIRLLNDCARLYPEAESLRSSCDQLDPYSVATRYPSALPEPSHDDALMATMAAARVYRTVVAGHTDRRSAG